MVVSHFNEMNDPIVTTLVGLCLLVGFPLYVRWSLRADGDSPTTSWFYMFITMGFAASLDGVIALSIMNVTSFADFYLDNAEVYFRSGHGAAINLWDATFQYGCYLYLASVCFRKNQSIYNEPVLYVWLGSIMNSMPVFLLAGFSSPLYQMEITPAILLNVPFFVLPFVVLSNAMSHVLSEDSNHNKRRSEMSFERSPLDALCVLGLLVLVAFHCFRLIVSLGSTEFDYHLREPYLRDRSLFPAVQCMVYVFTMIPLIFSVVRALIVSQQFYATFKQAEWWALVVLGVHLQGQFAFIAGSLYQPSRYALVASDTVSDRLFWALNVGLCVVVPALAALRLRSKEPAANGKEF